MILTETTVSPL